MRSAALRTNPDVAPPHPVDGGTAPDPRRPHRVAVRPAPRREPPYDDERPHLRLVGPNDQVLPFEDLTVGRRAAPPNFGHRPTTRAELSDPVAFSRRLLIGTLEIFAGRRSIAQLSPYLSRGVFLGLARDCDNERMVNRWSGAAAVRSVHVCEPVDGVAEIAAVISVRGGRCRAVALRLEGLDGRWRCVRLQLG